MLIILIWATMFGSRKETFKVCSSRPKKQKGGGARMKRSKRGGEDDEGENEKEKVTFNVKTTTYVTEMCGNSSELHYGLDISRADMMRSIYFVGESAEDVPTSGIKITMQRLISVISYGKWDFTPENNIIHQAIIPLRATCASDGTAKCDVEGWFEQVYQSTGGKAATKTHVPIVIIPDDVDCWFSGRSDVIYRGASLEGLVHELGHHVFRLDHSGCMCDAIPTKTNCTPSNCCDEPDLGANAVGDLTCVMGYGPGKFFNVAVSHEILKLAEPVAKLNRGQAADRGSREFSLPAMEKKARNFVMIHHDQVKNRHYFISYLMKSDPKWFRGYFNLDDALADHVCIHMWDVTRRKSYLIYVLAKNETKTVQYTFKKGEPDQRLEGFSVTFLSSDGLSAQIRVNIP